MKKYKFILWMELEWMKKGRWERGFFGFGKFVFKSIVLGMGRGFFVLVFGVFCLCFGVFVVVVMNF